MPRRGAEQASAGHFCFVSLPATENARLFGLLLGRTKQRRGENQEGMTNKEGMKA